MKTEYGTSRIVSRRGIITTAAVAAGVFSMFPAAAFADNASELKVFLNQINKDRVKKGYSELKLHTTISQVSQELSVKMAKAKKTIADTSYVNDSRVPDGWKDTIQIVAETYSSNGGSIYYETTEATAYKYLMTKEYNTVGLGLAQDSNKKSYLTISLFQYDNVSTTPAPVETRTFKDVSKNMQFRAEIEKLAELGISTGYSDGTYRPHDSVKRDAMIVFIYRAMGSPRYTAPAKSPFTDVSTKNQFYKEIAWAHDLGISTGWKMKNGTRQFRPYLPVQRDAVAAFLMRATNVKAPKAVKSFKDVAPTRIHAESITWMKQTGISTGWSDGTFRPLNETKRDAMAAFIIRWLDYLDK